MVLSPVTTCDVDESISQRVQVDGVQLGPLLDLVHAVNLFVEIAELEAERVRVIVKTEHATLKVLMMLIFMASNRRRPFWQCH